MNIASELAMLNFGQTIAQKIIAEFRTQPSENAVIELIGDVGAGKTTFTRGLAQGLGVSEPVTSPSFTISKRYHFPISGKTPSEKTTSENSSSKQPPSGELIHYDFYRLDDPGIMLGELAESLQNPRAVVVIEWGENVSDLLPKNHLRLEFQLQPNGSREVIISDKLLSKLTESGGKIFNSSEKQGSKRQNSASKLADRGSKILAKEPS